MKVEQKLRELGLELPVRMAIGAKKLPDRSVTKIMTVTEVWDEGE
jgi:hypothetical protein